VKRALSPFLLVALGCACRQTLSVPMTMRAMSVPELGPAEPDVRRTYWPGGPTPENLRSEIEGLTQRGGAFVKHGSERTFFPSGAREVERHWLLGTPAKTWRTWWEDGTLRSECEFPEDGRSITMSFWHANGKLEAQGTAIHGRRFGHWDFYHPNGERESSGELFDGKREGEWSKWNECGELIEQASYAKNVLVQRRTFVNAPGKTPIPSARLPRR
jgi:hypothetical protein